MSNVQKGIPTSEVLTKAADLIRDGEWVTGAGWPGAENVIADNQLCLEGGIMAALGIRYDVEKYDGGLTDLYTCPAYRAVHEYLVETGEIPEPKRLWQFNDASSTTRGKVLRTLRTVAAREKKKEEGL